MSESTVPASPWQNTEPPRDKFVLVLARYRNGDDYHLLTFDGKLWVDEDDGYCGRWQPNWWWIEVPEAPPRETS